MKHEDQKKIAKMISDAMQSFAGDLAEYLHYFNGRLSAVEDKLGIKVEGYHEFLGKSHKGG